MSRVVAAVAAVSGGFGAWSATEYLAHRFAMHSGPGRSPVAREHRRHHGQPEVTSPLMRLGAYAGIGAVASGAGIAAARVVGRGRAAGLAVGWFGGYAFYELSHWYAHHTAPRTGWGERLRVRHFRHHFGTPTRNHGVTTDLWDRLAGTEIHDDGPVRVPRRLAMEWLVDDGGEVRPEYRDHYVLSGHRRLDADQREADLVRAFADVVPVAD